MKEKGLIIFHNDVLVYVSSPVIDVFGETVFTILKKEISELFNYQSIEVLSTLNTERKQKLKLCTLTGVVLDCIAVKNNIKSESIITVFIETPLIMTNNKFKDKDKSAFEKIVNKNFDIISNKLKEIKTTRNQKEILEIKHEMYNFAFEMSDMIDYPKREKVVFYDDYTYFDFLTFLQTTTQEIINLKSSKKELFLLPMNIPPFTIYACPEKLKVLIEDIVKYFWDYDDSVYLEAQSDDEEIVLFISNIKRMKTFKLTPECSNGSIYEKLTALLKFEADALSSGATLKRFYYNYKYEVISISYNLMKRTKIYEEDL